MIIYIIFNVKKTHTFSMATAKHLGEVEAFMLLMVRPQVLVTTGESAKCKECGDGWQNTAGFISDTRTFITLILKNKKTQSKGETRNKGNQ